MTGFALTRRRFLTGAALAAAGTALPGCDAFDDGLALGSPLRATLEKANDLTWRVQRLLGGGHAMAPEFAESDIRQPMRPNGVTAPQDTDYQIMRIHDFRDWRLKVSGLVEKPLELSREELMAMPSRTQITRHDCVEGWSCIAKWTGVPLSLVLDQAVVKPDARYVLFNCMDTIEQTLSGGVRYFGTIDLVDARHPQTILAYGMNGRPLPVENGAPLRVRVERQLGYKQPKYLREIVLVAGFGDIGAGKGGYWEDRGYDWFGGI